ncbi:MAG: hypothetical protein ACXQTQ_03430 [Candidatus Hecatellaceae archaeon]
MRTRRVHCKPKHIDAYVSEWDDGRVTVRCVFRKYCSECPFESPQQK